ncbi:MAG: permease [Planctomycetota bacterium]
MEPKTGLFIALGVVAGGYALYWAQSIALTIKTIAANPNPANASELQPGAPSPIQLAIGFITDFFDTLGIGSFATTTALFKALKQCGDRVIPGTLNVGHTLPTIAQAFIYTQLIEVDFTTLVSMIVASVAGAWLGAGFVSGLSKRKVQIGMGVALLAAVSILLYRLIPALLEKPDPAASAPQDTGTIALEGTKLWIGIGVNFVLGALMTLGIGLYAPCMILVQLLGMNSKVAFPIMMGSCAFLMPIASFQFIKKNSYSMKAALGLALGGIPAVLIAAFLVKELPLDYVKWLVVIVVTITAISMLRSAFVSNDKNTP